VHRGRNKKPSAKGKRKASSSKRGERRSKRRKTRGGEVRRIERGEARLEASRVAEGERGEATPHGGNEGPVEAEEERQGNDGEPNAQQRVMTVGEVGEPATDDDASDQLI
jgi:hypothetical protein